MLAEKQLTFLCDFRTLRSDYVNAKEKVTSKIDVNTETLCLAVSLFFSSSTLSIQQSQLHFRPHNFLPLQTKNNWGIEKSREKCTCNDVTALLSPVSRLARYCTQPEVKFDAFKRLLKRGEEKLRRNTRTTLTFDQANKKSLSHILQVSKVSRA